MERMADNVSWGRGKTLGRGCDAGGEPRWEGEVRGLRGYIESHPEIGIGADEVCIPGEWRAGFYQRFDTIRRAVVESWDPSLYAEVRALSQSFLAAERRLSETLSLEVGLAQDLSSFLRSPAEGLMRLIHGRLFELIQGKISGEDFARLAAGDLAAGAAGMFRIGYETWAALAMILLLEPDGIWGIALDGDGRPLTTEMREIAFGRQFHHPARRIPEFVFHSKKLGGHVAFKMPLAGEVNAYRVPVEMPTQRLLRNRNGDSSSVLGPRMIFLSVVRDLKDIPIFADLHKRTVHGPDLSIECVTDRDLAAPEILGQIQNRLDILRPRLGGTLALVDAKSKPQAFTTARKMRVVSAGLEASGFQPVVDALAEPSIRHSASEREPKTDTIESAHDGRFS